MDKITSSRIYKRTIQGLYHTMQRLGIYKKHQTKKKEKVNRMNGYQGEYPGDKGSK